MKLPTTTKKKCEILEFDFFFLLAISRLLIEIQLKFTFELAIRSFISTRVGQVYFDFDLSVIKLFV